MTLATTSMNASSFCCFYPVGWSEVFSEQELASCQSEDVRVAFHARYMAAAIAASKSAAMQVKTFKAQEIERGNGPKVFAICLGQLIAEYSQDGNCPQTAQEWLLVDGMVYRTIEALNAASYAAEKEDFSFWAAAELARSEGKRFVIVEDLS